MKSRILICNDDGIYSPGIASLAKVASRFGHVRIVAPDVEQSSMGHAITSSRPLRYRRTPLPGDRKSTRLNSSHSQISYAVFCLKKKKKTSSHTHRSCPFSSSAAVLLYNVLYCLATVHLLQRPIFTQLRRYTAANDCARRHRFES